MAVITLNICRLLTGRLWLWIALWLYGGVCIPLAAAETGGTAAFQAYLDQAQKGSAISQYMVARSYELGQGIGKNDAKAAQWYAKASKGGFTEADVSLGLLEIEGRGVDRNVKKGLQRLFSAAERGNILARYHLGFFYMHGKHIKKDLIEAYKWLFLASHLPRTPESFKAKKLMTELEKTMSKRQIKKSRKALREFTPEQQ